jgi:glutathione S-transferase
MKLYFAPEYSSLADDIALLEAGIEFQIVEVDLETKRLTGGGACSEINPMELVPAPMFDDGQVVTENLAILTWAADRAPHLAPTGELDRYRLLEVLNFIACEIYKRFPILFTLPQDAQEPVARGIARWFRTREGRLGDGYLFGDRFTVADAYLFILVRGALQAELPVSDTLRDYVSRIEGRPAVQEALRREAAGSAA